MSKKVVIDREELENFLYYLADKVDSVYEREVEKSVKRFLEDVSR